MDCVGQTYLQVVLYFLWQLFSAHDFQLFRVEHVVDRSAEDPSALGVCRFVLLRLEG